jgi:hypothetical protein
MDDIINIEELKASFIVDLKQADVFQSKIQSTKDKIHGLRNGVESKISDLVYDCHDPEELGKLCDDFGLDNKGYRWGWDKAYENSNSHRPNYEKQEWCDVLSSVTQELQSYIRKQAKIP